MRWIGQSPDGESVVLHRYHGAFTAPDFVSDVWLEEHKDEWRWGAALDTETTGVDSLRDKIIEIGIRTFRFHRETGQILTRDEGYSELADPGEPLRPEIVRITGITDAMLAGKQIDWSRVQTILEQCHLILAHNAEFDRPFLDRYLPLSASKIWGCSFKQVDWAAKHFPSQKLEILAIYHGFYNDAHRALADADTLLHLLGMPDPESGDPYLKELLGNARRRQAVVFATQSPRETKDKLRERRYRWNTERRVWLKRIFMEEVEEEKIWLTREIYEGVYRGTVLELPLCDSFKHLSRLDFDL